jgi:hypothetical protein
MNFFDYFSTYEGQWKFFVKYFLPVFLILFSWVLIGNLIEINYRIDNLNKITGRIININEVQTLNSKKNQDYELRLYLNNYPNYFRITDNFKYQNIQNKLKFGDEVQIYFRPKYMVVFGFGKQRDVYQLESKNEILFDLDNRKRNSKGLMIISTIFLLIFGTVYFFCKKET